MKTIVGTGHPRTGTGYTSRILNFLCPNIGHELLKNRGIVSWFSVVQDKCAFNHAFKKGWVPRYIPINLNSSINLQIFRNPLDSLASIIHENNNYNSFIFRDHLISLSQFKNNPTEQAVESLLRWNDFIQSEIPVTLKFNVESDSENLFDFFKTEKLTKKSKNEFLIFIGALPKNTNHKARPIEIKHDFSNISNDTILKFKEFSDKLGYSNDIDNPFMINHAERNLLSHYNKNVNSYSCLNYCDIFDIFKNIKYPIQSMLDLGCGTGKILNSVSPHIYDGVDISSTRIAAVRGKFPQYNFHIKDMNIFLAETSSTYDIITIFETLEHMDNPTKIVTKCKERLNKGGMIIGSVPVNLPYKAHLHIFKTYDDIEKLGVSVIHRDEKHFYFIYENT